MVSYLLSKQSWADAQDAQDNTPLHLAARYMLLLIMSGIHSSSRPTCKNAWICYNFESMATVVVRMTNYATNLSVCVYDVAAEARVSKP